MGRRLERLAVVFGTALAAFIGTDLPQASGSCVAPRLQVEPVRVAPGDVVHLVGHGWMAECGDTWTCDAGGECTAPEPSPPADSVAVSFEQGEHSQLLVTARPDAAYAFDVEASVPADATAGPALVVAQADNGWESLPLAVEVVAATAPDPSGGPEQSGEELPRTGPTAWASLIGLGLLLIGCGSVMSRLSRSHG